MENSCSGTSKARNFSTAKKKHTQTSCPWMAIPRRKKNTLSNRQIVMIIAQDNQSNGTCTCVRVYVCKCVRAFASAQPMIEVISGNFGSISPARWSAHEFTFWCPTPKVCNINSVAGRAVAAGKKQCCFCTCFAQFFGLPLGV